MTSLLHDVRYAARQLLRTPAFTAAAVITLALGIGANTAFFGAVDAFVYRPMRAVDLTDVSTLFFRAKVARYPHARHYWLKQLEATPPAGLAAVTGVNGGTVLAHIPGRAERVGVEKITSGYRDVLRLNPQAGRFIEKDDEVAAARVAVISDRLWRQWFDARHDAIGRAAITIRDQSFDVVGVAPAGYAGLTGLNAVGSVDIWLPLATWERRIERISMTGNLWTTLLVRTVPGARPAEVGEQIRSVVMQAPLPDMDLQSVTVSPIGAGAGPWSWIGRIVLSLSMFVLLAACANLANMLLARGANRLAELAIRRSLGASSLRIFRLLVIETALIAFAASAIGLAIAVAAIEMLQSAVPSIPARSGDLPMDVRPDAGVFFYALAAAVAVTVAVGAATAFRASRVAPARALAAGDAATSISRAGRRVRLGLVALQVTAAMVLLFGAGNMILQTSQALEERVMFDTRPLAAARLDLSQHGFTDARARVFLSDLVPRVRQLPGIEQSVLSDGMPGAASLGGAGTTFAAEKVVPGQPEARWINASNRRSNGRVISASAGFLSTIGLPIVEGRDLQPADREGAPLVIVISRSLANRLWPDGTAPGQRLMLGNEGGWRTVVGIFADATAATSQPPSWPGSNLAVVPIDQRYLPGVTSATKERYERQHLRELLIVVRADDPSVRIGLVQKAARELDERVAIFDAATVDESILEWVAPLRASRMLTATLAFMSLAIATAGVYGVLAFLVSRRTREFGIRMALGARRRQIVKMVFDEALHVLLVGLLAGVFVCAVGERLINYRMFAGILRPNEISMWIVVPLLILMVGLLAALIPARRAAGIDPNVALRDL